VSETQLSLLSPADQAVIEEEERLLASLQDAVRAATERGGRARPYEERMRQLLEEMATAHEGDLPALLVEYHRAKSAAARVRPDLPPDLRVPYFAHMRLRSGERERDVLLGYRTFIDAKHGVTVVDWREAPIAQVFFNYREGDAYEEEYPGRLSEGVLDVRRVLTFDDGQLVQIMTPEGTLQRPRASSIWTRERPGHLPELSGGEGGDPVKRIIGTGLSGRRLPVVSSLLDPKQYDALTRDPDQPLLILGGAGCGKTTVALHRLAYLAYQDKANFQPRSMIVLVPEEGLVRLTRSLLHELGLGEVQVSTVEGWMAQQVRRMFRGLPKRESEDTPGGVIRFKRHPAMRAVLQEQAERSAQQFAHRMDDQLGTRGAFETLFREAPPKPVPYARLKWSLNRLRKGMSDSESKAVWKVFKRQRKAYERVAEDRRRLLREKDLLRRAVELSNGELHPGLVDDVFDYSTLQFAERAEEEWSHVDEDRLQALDGRPLDDGTPTEAANSIDVEDYALMLELYRIKTGGMTTGYGKMATYSHVVVDEAQDLAPIELSVIGSAMRREGSVTVAGDPSQQIDVSVQFGGWESVLGSLGVDRFDPVVLETSYRCTAPIADFGYRLLGPIAPDDVPAAAKSGAPVSQSLFPNEMHAAVFLAEALRDLLVREPRAQVAVIAREPDTAKRLFKTLQQSFPARLVLDGRFSFKPGVDVTVVPQVKGLEFDYVVIPDASTNHYPDDPASRRLLYVAATRAIHQLWVIAVGKRSSLLPEPH